VKLCGALFVAALSAALASSVLAGLGDTLEQSIKKHGLPSDGPTESVRADATSYAFTGPEWDISITYFDGRAVEVMVGKADASTLSQPEINQWLRDSSQLPWRQKQATEWETGDGETASLSGDYTTIHIWSATWHRIVAEVEAKLQQEEQQRFGGDKAAADKARNEELQKTREASDRAREEVDAKLRELRKLLER
jgi:hypothetical protein